MLCMMNKERGMKTMNKIELGTIIRTVCLVLALINQGLTMAGHSLLPITDEQVAEGLTLAATIVTSLIAWWKNNSFTQAALEGDKVMHEIKAGETNTEEE